MRYILAADIGGTNCRLGQFVHDGTLRMEHTTWIRTAGLHDIDDLLQAWQQVLPHHSLQQADVLVLAVAGQIRDGVRVRTTNADLELDLRDIEHRYGLRNAILINDFIAQAHACVTEAGRRARIIQSGTPEGTGRQCIAVIGAGTGLGKAMLIASAPGHWMALPSEGGHAAFPFVGQEEAHFEAFIRKKRQLPYVRGDDVLTGMGLSLLTAFLEGRDMTPQEVAATYLATNTTVRQWYTRFYARACRDWMLTSLCDGGLYIAGGIAAKNPEVIDCDAFRNEISQAPIYADFLRSIPIRLLLDEDSGLWGAAGAGVAALTR